MNALRIGAALTFLMAGSFIVIGVAKAATDVGPRSGSGGGMETGKSGTGKETDAGQGITGQKSPFGADQPTSGDFSPKEGAASDQNRGSQEKTARGTDMPQGSGSDFPPGIGEKGTGQKERPSEPSGTGKSR